MADIDKLQIKIGADSKNAVKSLDDLIDRLNRVSTAIGTVDSGRLNNFSDSLTRLSHSMNTIKGVDKRTFSSLASKLNSIAKVDYVGMKSTANSLHNMASAISKINGVSAGTKDVADLGTALAKLGYKSVTQAITNIPLLARSMSSLLTELSKAPVVSRNVIDLTNALANLSNQGARVGSATRSMNRAMNNFAKTSNNVGKSASSLASAFGKFYATYFLAIRGVKKLWEGVESSMNYVETYNYFKVTFDKINREFTDIGAEGATNYVNGFQGQIEELLTKMTGYQLGANGELFSTGNVGLGLDPKQLMQFQAKIGAVTNSVGLIGQTSIDTSKALSMLVADISSLTNTGIDTVMTNLSSGLIGQSRALYKYGIDITNNTLQQYALAEGIEKSVSEMTQSEKMQLRMIAILDQSRVAWADQARTINSVANQYRIFEQQSANLGRTFGNLLLPMVQNLLPYLNGLVIAMNNVLTTFGFKLHGDNWLSDLNDGTSDGAGAIEEIDDALNEADESATKLKQNLMGFDELNVINSSKTNQGLTGIGDVDLSQSIHNALLDYEKVWDDAIKESNNKAQELAKVIQGNLEKIFGVFYDVDEEHITAVTASIIGLFAAITTFNAINKTAQIASSIGTLLTTLSAHPYVAIAAGIVGVTTALVAWYKDTSNIKLESVENAIAVYDDALGKLDTSYQTFADTIGKLDSEKEKVKSAIESYFSLINDNSIDFAEKESQLQNYVSYITTKFPSLKQYVDSHTGLFNTNKEAILENVEALHEYAKAQAIQQYTTTAYSDLFDLKASYKKYLEKLDKAKSDIIEKYTTTDMYGNLLLKTGWKVKEKMDKELKDLEDNRLAMLEAISKQEEFIKKLESGDVDSIFGEEEIENANKFRDIISELADNVPQELKDMGKGAETVFNDLNKSIVNDMKNAFGESSLFVKNFGTLVEDTTKKTIENLKKMTSEITNSKIDSISVPSLKTPFLPVQAYSTGGFPEDGLFYANHNEIVGKFSNGQTAVANNDQITSGIAEAVYPAVYNAMMNAFNNSNNGNLSVQIDGREVFKATRKYASEYQRTTGNQAFSF